MTESSPTKLTHWRRLAVDALTAIAAFALAFAAINGTTEVLQQVLLAAVLMATAAIVEPQAMALRRRDRRARHSARSSPAPA